MCKAINAQRPRCAIESTGSIAKPTPAPPTATPATPQGGRTTTNASGVVTGFSFPIPNGFR